MTPSPAADCAQRPARDGHPAPFLAGRSERGQRFGEAGEREVLAHSADRRDTPMDSLACHRLRRREEILALIERRTPERSDTRPPAPRGPASRAAPEYARPRRRGRASGAIASWLACSSPPPARGRAPVGEPDRRSHRNARGCASASSTGLPSASATTPRLRESRSPNSTSSIWSPRRMSVDGRAAERARTCTAQEDSVRRSSSDPFRAVMR